MYLIKTDSSGNEQWNKTFGGNGNDFGFSVQQTTDGGYIITGYTRSYGNGEEDIWLIKTDSQGNEEWNKVFGVIGGDEDPRAIIETSDGGYIICTDSKLNQAATDHVSVLKLDYLGNLVNLNGHNWSFTLKVEELYEY